jgi:SAM-dependent methyltransferase
MADHYADGTYRWWHLSRPSPELVSVLDDGWLPRAGRAVDLGSGLGSEAGYLARRGWQVTGVDLSAVAVGRAAAEHGGAFLRADARRLPFAAWRIEHLEQAAVPSDTRMLDVLVVRLCTD